MIPAPDRKGRCAHARCVPAAPCSAQRSVGTASKAADVAPRRSQSRSSPTTFLELTMTTLRHSHALATVALLVLLAAMFVLLATFSGRDNTPIQIARPPNGQIQPFRAASA